MSIWPQGAPDKSTEIVSGDKIGMHKPTEDGTTNVKADVDDLKTFFQGDLATGITENADNITLNTANIGVNSGQVEANKDNIESNDADILALQAKTPQSYKTTDSPTFEDATIGGHAIDSELDSLNVDVPILNGRVNQGVKITDSPEFESLKSGSSFLKWKTFSGSLSASGGAIFSHGLTSGNIISYQFMQWIDIATDVLKLFPNTGSSISGGTVYLSSGEASWQYKGVIFYT